MHDWLSVAGDQPNTGECETKVVRSDHELGRGKRGKREQKGNIPKRKESYIS